MSLFSSLSLFLFLLLLSFSFSCRVFSFAYVRCAQKNGTSMPLARRTGPAIVHTAPIHCGATTETAQAAKMRQVFRLRRSLVPKSPALAPLQRNAPSIRQQDCSGFQPDSLFSRAPALARAQAQRTFISLLISRLTRSADRKWLVASGWWLVDEGYETTCFLFALYQLK